MGYDAVWKEIKLFHRDVKVPIEHIYEELLQLIYILQRDAPDWRYVWICVVQVVEYLCGDQDYCENQPRQREEGVSFDSRGRRSYKDFHF